MACTCCMCITFLWSVWFQQGESQNFLIAPQTLCIYRSHVQSYFDGFKGWFYFHSGGKLTSEEVEQEAFKR